MSQVLELPDPKSATSFAIIKPKTYLISTYLRYIEPFQKFIYWCCDQPKSVLGIGIHQENDLKVLLCNVLLINAFFSKGLVGTWVSGEITQPVTAPSGSHKCKFPVLPQGPQEVTASGIKDIFHREMQDYCKFKCRGCNLLQTQYFTLKYFRFTGGYFAPSAHRSCRY